MYHETNNKDRPLEGAMDYLFPLNIPYWEQLTAYIFLTHYNFFLNRKVEKTLDLTLPNLYHH